MGFGFIVFCVIVIVVFFGVMIIVFTDKNKKTQPEIKKPTRRYIKDVKPQELIWIEWYRIKGGIGQLKCINNDPETKKILLEIRWGNYKQSVVNEYEKIVLDYDSKELVNFHLLNKLDISSPKSKDDDTDDYDIITLQKKMNEALDKQDYEYAEVLQKKIDKLSKKNK